MFKNILKLLVSIVQLCIRKKKTRIVYSSFPDFSDNSFAFFVYVLDNKPEYSNIWLVESMDIDKYQSITATYSKSKNFKIVKKRSVIGLYYYFSAKYIFHTHGLFNVFPLSNKQVVVNLFHAMPLKVVGLLDGKKEFMPSHFTISTSKIFRKIMSDACGIPMDKVLVTGQPRNEFLFERKATLNELFNPEANQNRKTILWMPTYRKSDFGEIREDGDSFNDDLMSEQSLDSLNTFLKKADSNCFVKLHPMDINKKNGFKRYSNIIFLDNNSFNDHNINMYSCFSCIDVLLTDYSSIYIDLLILNKPIGFVISDFKSYQNSRGFTIENPMDYMPGEIIYTLDDLLNFLNKVVVLNKDNYSEDRLKINQKFNEVYKNSSERIFNNLVLNKK